MLPENDTPARPGIRRGERRGCESERCVWTGATASTTVQHTGGIRGHDKVLALPLWAVKSSSSSCGMSVLPEKDIITGNRPDHMTQYIQYDTNSVTYTS